MEGPGAGTSTATCRPRSRPPAGSAARRRGRARCPCRAGPPSRRPAGSTAAALTILDACAPDLCRVEPGSAASGALSRRHRDARLQQPLHRGVPAAADDVVGAGVVVEDKARQVAHVDQLLGKASRSWGKNVAAIETPFQPPQQAADVVAGTDDRSGPDDERALGESRRDRQLGAALVGGVVAVAGVRDRRSPSQRARRGRSAAASRRPIRWRRRRSGRRGSASAAALSRTARGAPDHVSATTSQSRRSRGRQRRRVGVRGRRQRPPTSAGGRG